jgi:hypothetical protein
MCGNSFSRWLLINGLFVSGMLARVDQLEPLECYLARFGMLQDTLRDYIRSVSSQLITLAMPQVYEDGKLREAVGKVSLMSQAGNWRMASGIAISSNLCHCFVSM